MPHFQLFWQLFPSHLTSFWEASIFFLIRHHPENVCALVLSSRACVLQEVAQEHKDTLDRDNPKDLMDAYLIEMEKDNPDSTCSGITPCLPSYTSPPNFPTSLYFYSFLFPLYIFLLIYESFFFALNFYYFLFFCPWPSYFTRK